MELNRKNKTYINMLDVYDTYFSSIYDRLRSAEQFYPYFKNWYFEKVVPEILNNKRDILFEIRDNSVVGLSLVKFEEKKLCTLKVFEEYQNKGFGLQLFEKSFEVLETDKPFLTVSEEKYLEFKKIFEHYNFELTDVKKGLYRNDKLEYFFNQR